MRQSRPASSNDAGEYEVHLKVPRRRSIAVLLSFAVTQVFGGNEMYREAVGSDVNETAALTRCDCLLLVSNVGEARLIHNMTRFL